MSLYCHKGREPYNRVRAILLNIQQLRLCNLSALCEPLDCKGLKVCYSAVEQSSPVFLVALWREHSLFYVVFWIVICKGIGCITIEMRFECHLSLGPVSYAYTGSKKTHKLICPGILKGVYGVGLHNHCLSLIEYVAAGNIFILYECSVKAGIEYNDGGV